MHIYQYLFYKVFTAKVVLWRVRNYAFVSNFLDIIKATISNWWQLYGHFQMHLNIARMDVMDIVQNLFDPQESLEIRQLNMLMSWCYYMQPREC